MPILVLYSIAFGLLINFSRLLDSDYASNSENAKKSLIKRVNIAAHVVIPRVRDSQIKSELTKYKVPLKYLHAIFHNLIEMKIGKIEFVDDINQEKNDHYLDYLFDCVQKQGGFSVIKIAEIFILERPHKRLG